MFEIATGNAEPARLLSVGFVQGLMDGVLDSLPDNAPQDVIDDKLAQAVTGVLRGPKTLASVRGKLVALWPLIAPLAERQPEQFDAILLEYLDRQQTLG
jgi:hypothetical protein